MRILNFIPEEKIGGMVLRAIRLAKAMPVEFISIIATPQISDELRQKIEGEGLLLIQFSIHRIRKSNNIKFWLKWGGNFFADINASRIIFRNLKIDVLHMNGLLNLQMVLAAKMCHLPVVWHLNDTLPYIPKIVRRVLGKLVAGIAVHIVCSSEAVASYVFGKKWERIERLTVLGVPVESMRFQAIDTSAGKRVRQKFGFGMHGEMVLGTVSNVNPNKNIALQLKILNGLVERGMDSQLVVVGPVFSSQAKHFDGLVRMARDLGVEKRVFFTGYQEKVEDLLRSFDIFIFTSLSESGPMVILEAMLTGLPIVTSRVGLVPSIPANLGVFSIEISSRHELARAFIDKICDIVSEGKRPDIGPRQGFIEKTFDVRVLAEKLESVYRGIEN